MGFTSRPTTARVTLQGPPLLGGTSIGPDERSSTEIGGVSLLIIVQKIDQAGKPAGLNLSLLLHFFKNTEASSALNVRFSATMGLCPSMKLLSHSICQIRWVSAVSATVPSWENGSYPHQT